LSVGELSIQRRRLLKAEDLEVEKSNPPLLKMPMKHYKGSITL
jgi:hypothetical protein